MFQIILNSQIQNLALQLVIEKIAITPYYIMAIVDHPMSMFLSRSFSLLLMLKVEDQNIEIPRPILNFDGFQICPNLLTSARTLGLIY
jgi:hypothetical protein